MAVQGDSNTPLPVGTEVSWNGVNREMTGTVVGVQFHYIVRITGSDRYMLLDPRKVVINP